MVNGFLTIFFLEQLLLMAEVLRSPVEVGRFSSYLQGFIDPEGGCLGFLNHQQLSK